MKLVAFATMIGLVLIAGCGTSGSSISVVPPVQAQSYTYSNSSISGTYSIVLANPFGNPVGMGFSQSIGTFTADGSGNISAGTITERQAGNDNVCSLALTGTYSIQSNASGTITLNTKSTLVSGSGSCRPNGAITFNVFTGQQGAALLFNETDTNSMLSGSAVKQ